MGGNPNSNKKKKLKQKQKKKKKRQVKACIDNMHRFGFQKPRNTNQIHYCILISRMQKKYYRKIKANLYRKISPR